MRSVRIANGQGFWGDNVDAPLELLRGGPIDYLGMDYLAEVTLSIMMRQKLRNPQLGYATDFLDFARRALPDLAAKGVKVITNAGGLNPRACRERVFEIARELGITGLRIGVGLSWLAIIAAEMLIGGVGIGFFIWDAWNSSRISDIILALVYVGLVGFALDRIVAFIGRKVTRGTAAS